MNKEFCMKIATLKSSTRYCVLDMHPHTGDMKDIYRHPITGKACGENMSYGTLFAYLFRRFGYPNAGWDDYKDLTKYYLSTPLPDMILRVIPFVGDDTFIHFKFFVTETTSRILEAFERKAFTEFQQRMFDWIEANHLLPEWMDGYVQESNKALGIKRDWREAFGDLSYFNHENDDSSFKYIGDWYSEVTSRYGKIEPCPRCCVTRSLNWEEWPDEDPLKKYYDAAYETLLDLRRPVQVRDAHINAFGRIPDEELDKYPGDGGYAAAAGYPSGSLGNEAPAEFAKIQARILELGKGDVKKGIKMALKLCSGHANT